MFYGQNATVHRGPNKGQGETRMISFIEIYILICCILNVGFSILLLSKTKKKSKRYSKHIKYIKTTPEEIELEFKTKSGKKVNFKAVKPKANVKIVSKIKDKEKQE